METIKIKIDESYPVNIVNIALSEMLHEEGYTNFTTDINENEQILTIKFNYLTSDFRKFVYQLTEDYRTDIIY